MIYKYGEFTANQIAQNKKLMRGKIFKLLLMLDPDTKEDQAFSKYRVSEYFNDILTRLDGMNELFGYPKELVQASALLEEARIEADKDDYSFLICKKLLFDAGAEIQRIVEV